MPQRNQVDGALATHFDQKLKQVMEELSTSVQNAQDEDDVISQTQEKRDEAVNLLAVKKKEKSQWSLFQLYMVCAEKICSKDLEE